MKCPIYVISLARAKDRRTNVTKRLNKAGVSYEIIDAVDGQTLQASQYEHRLRQDLCLKYYQTQLSKGQIGCYLSHYNIWWRMQDEQTAVALVLEDDAVWKDSFFQIVESALQAPWQWDVINFAHNKASKIKTVLCPLVNEYQLVRYKHPGLTTAGYLIAQRGVKKLLPYCHEIHASIDTTWLELWANKLEFYDVTPPPAGQSGETPVIDYPAQAMQLSRQQKKQRQRMRTYRGFRRKLHYLLNSPKRQGEE